MTDYEKTHADTDFETFAINREDKSILVLGVLLPTILVLAVSVVVGITTMVGE